VTFFKRNGSRGRKVPCFFLFLHLKQIVIMGRGDKRTKRGKITIGSFGKTRLARAVKKAKVKAEPKA